MFVQNFKKKKSVCKNISFQHDPFLIIFLASACIQKGDIPWCLETHTLSSRPTDLYETVKTILFLLCWGGVSCSTHGIRQKSKEDVSVIASSSVNNLLELVPRGSSMEDGYCMLIVLVCCVLAPAAKPPRNVFSLAIAVLPHDSLSLCSHFYFCLMAHLTSVQQHILSLCMKLTNTNTSLSSKSHYCL